MEEAYNKLVEAKNNNVDNLVKWMKDANLIEKSEEAEEKARKLFEDVKDVKDVELAKFKQAVSTLAEEQKKSVEEFCKMLSVEGPKLLSAIQAGASAAATAGATAFKEAMK
ncbi:Ubiquinone biosynthesis monooxygenase Coq7 [Operophtera brumata]|uniref:Ubiquinone biosynthesis monooxygenase Coq7 n=1 Tax=Operophtera brumata TaxID=104452 RepID=A0A0L7LDA3_OPEBR|nr:Ubiquinone biosynthesis monooxygenase Coq7 [Operophtera brumata]